MKNYTTLLLKLFLLQFLIIFLFSCQINQSHEKSKSSIAENTAQFKTALQKHLNAVSNKDSIALKSTMSPTGEMQLILPSSEIIYTVDEFMNYHKTWFKDTTTVWTFETKIMNTEVSDNLGIATTQIVYREKERNGKPYFNRMIVTYALKKIDGNWYIIKDHASSIEKSTDKK